MEIGLVVLLGLSLNLSGAVLAKLLATHLNTGWMAMWLALLLGLTFVCRVAFWFVAGRRWQLSYIYPFLSINYALAMGLGVIFFNEQIQASRIVGTLIVTTGVWVLSRSGFKREAL